MVACALPGNPYDGHTLDEAIEQVGSLANPRPRTVMVDKGYRGVEVHGVQILRSGQKRGGTRTMKAMVKRRSMIEPTIGHMTADWLATRSKERWVIHHALCCVAPDTTSDYC